MSDRHPSMVRTFGLLAVLPCLFAAQARGQASQPDKSQDMQFQWLAFPDETRFKLLGLFWHEENSPKLWRMPAASLDSLPKGVKARAKAPSGGRILIKCDTSKLGLKVTPSSGLRPLAAAPTTRGSDLPHSSNEGSHKGFDVYINGRFLRSVNAGQPDASRELVLFRELPRDQREIVVYLPYHQEVTIESVGVDPDTRFERPVHKYARPLPVVFYGSSVCQGSGASKPGMTYEAIACRQLDLDFVNLGFGGAGKAEKEVVDLVAAIPACCYVFDLGKSYGLQDGSAYKQMLQTVRTKHPGVPIICITPITSSKEVHDEDYSRKSVHTRTVMREAVKEFVASGEKKVYLVEGPDLLGFDEHDGLSKDGVHPSDSGYGVVAGKLLAVLRQALRE